MFCDWWLYSWSLQEHTLQLNNISDGTVQNNLNFGGTDEDFYIYLGLFLGFLLFSFVKSLVFSMIAINVGRKLHKKLFCAIMRAPLSFFEKTSVGEFKCYVHVCINFLRELMVKH